MGYLDGFLVTIRQHRLFGGKRVTTEYSGGRDARKKGKPTDPDVGDDAQDRQARAVARPARPQPLRGRHGEVHRLRAVRRRVPGASASTCAAPTTIPSNPTSPGERFGFVYEINYLRCIHCDLCVEACPTEAITESKLFEFSFTNRQDAIYTKDELLVDDDGKPKQLPWEDWRDGEDELTSGWMRATSPSGDATFGGVVGWSGELGYGVRAPEPPQDAGGRVMQMVVFVLASAMVIAGAIGVIVRAQPGARRAFARAHPVRRRRPLRRPRRPLPRRRAGDRLRRRDRRAVPVRDHAARRRQGRRPVDRAVPDPAPAGGGGRASGWPGS